MPHFNHAFTIAFEVISDCEDASDVTPEMLKNALLKRIADLDASCFVPGVPSLGHGGEWFEAVGAPFDTHEED